MTEMRREMQLQSAIWRGRLDRPQRPRMAGSYAEKDENMVIRRSRNCGPAAQPLMQEGHCSYFAALLVDKPP